MSNLYEDLYLATHKSLKDPEADIELQQSAVAFLEQFGTGDLIAVINVAQNYVGENAHLMESEDVAGLRAAIKRLEGVYR